MVRRLGITFGSLTSEIPVRIFIGTDDTQMLGAKVLEYSVRKHCPLPVVFDTMDRVKAPMPKDAKNRPRTGFSFNRFAIPSLAGYRGRAVYVDADMMVFRNFQELWDLPFGGATVLYAGSSDAKRPKQFSVLLLNCAQLKWNLDEIVLGLDEGRYDYEKLMKEMCIEAPEAVQGNIPPEWNSLEEYSEGKTGLIHYTDMMTQPWVSRKNRNGDLWIGYLLEAIEQGAITWDEVKAAIKAGFARPSLLWQLKTPRRFWPMFNKCIAPVLDLGFKPHKVLNTRLKKAAS